MMLSAQLAVGMYCISTEYRFLEQQKEDENQAMTVTEKILKNEKISEEVSDSENFLSRALEIAYIYLPHDIPIVG